jgi:hypothetical protein
VPEKYKLPNIGRLDDYYYLKEVVKIEDSLVHMCKWENNIYKVLNRLFLEFCRLRAGSNDGPCDSYN